MRFSSARLGPDDAFLTTILRLLRQLPIYPMFGRGMTRLQPAYVEDVAEAIGRTMRRAQMPSTIFEFGGPRVYSYEEFLGAGAHPAGLAPRLIPIPLAFWHALARVSETFPSPLLTRNQVELMQIDTVSSPKMPGFVELGISPQSVEAILQKRCCRMGHQRT
jgi:NADH dehydrogenase